MLAKKPLVRGAESFRCPQMHNPRQSTPDGSGTETRVLGLESAEFESEWPDGRPNPPGPSIEALKPVLNAIC
jgi:hypothetical protein